MIEIERTTEVDKHLTGIVDYLADFAHAERWDPGTVSCVRVGDGPVEVGATWRNVSEFRGKETEIEYTLTRREPGRLTFTGENKTVSTVDDLTFEGSGDRTRIRYHARFDFHGVATLAQPFVKGDLEELGDTTIAQLKDVLEDILEV